MAERLRGWGALLLLNLLLVAPLAVAAKSPLQGLALSADLALLAALLAWSGRRGPIAVLYMLLLVYEVDRCIGRFLMGQDPLLLDQVLLARHLVVLVTDLYGGWGPVALAGALSLVLLLGLGSWLLWGRAARARGLGRLGWAAPALALLSWLLPAEWGARCVGPALAWDVGLSTRVLVELDRELGRLHPELGPLELRARPDIEVHVVESYGRMVDSEGLGERWREALERHQGCLAQAGWSMRSAWSEAPVSGGRSWIADASLLLGMPISYQSEYERIQPRIPELPHLPAWLRERGYSTTVMRPKDRARQGIELRNDFGWQHTVFWAELGYQGPSWGWGGIPDQYSLGWLREELWEQLPRPRFLFFHMVGSHAPWEGLPPLVDDWRSLDDGSGGVAEESYDFKTRREALRFKRQKRTHRFGGRLAIKGEDYLAAVLAELDVLAQDLCRPRSEPAVVLILGDHQPPLIAMDESFDVPVHALATDPSLLQGWGEEGFSEGLAPSGQGPPLWELYPLLASSLSH